MHTKKIIMNALNNSVTLIGFLGTDVDYSILPSGTKLAKTVIATNSYYKDKNGEKVQKTEWHPVVAWNKTAELMSQLLKKGSQVLIQGQLNHDSYKTKDGEMKYYTQVKINEFKNFTQKDENLPF